jgi:hypothetical protein
MWKQFDEVVSVSEQGGHPVRADPRLAVASITISQ